MTELATPLRDRLWRARRRHSYIDAFLRPQTTGWLLEFHHDGRPFLTWRFDLEAEAVAEADRRLRDLQRSGWNTHW